MKYIIWEFDKKECEYKLNIDILFPLIKSEEIYKWLHIIFIVQFLYEININIILKIFIKFDIIFLEKFI